MEQLIVDVETKGKGQKYSAGGVRENGKLVFQYKNPRPYHAPQTTSGTSQSQEYPASSFKPIAKQIAMGIAYDILQDLWAQIGKPLLKQKFSEFQQSHMSIHTPKPIQENSHIKERNNSNIIHFPKAE